MLLLLAKESVFERCEETARSLRIVRKDNLLNLTDDQLVERTKQGDKRAFGTLVQRWQRQVYSQCLRQLRNPLIAEEVAQDVFIAVYRAIPSFRAEARFSTWLFRIVINHCKNKVQYQIRRHKERHEPLEGLNPEIPRELPVEEPNAEQVLQKKKMIELLQDALAQLDEKQRAIIVLRDVQGLSYEEICEILSLPKGTVKSRIHRARQEVAKLLKGKISAADLGR